MSRRVMLFATAFGLLAAAPVSGQNQSYSGSFAREYPEAAAKLHSFSMVHANMLESIYNNPTVSVGQLDGPMVQGYLGQIRGAEGVMSHSMGAAMPSFAQAAPQLISVLDWAHTFRQELYDILADPNLQDKDSAVGFAVDRYLSRSDLALPATLKAMGMMHDQDYSMAFSERYPAANGLMWATHWLQLAVFDPLLYYSDPSAREDGIENVVSRFDEIIADTASFPKQMPTPAAITPELTVRYPRAAAILNNLNMLHDMVADIVIDSDVSDKRMAIDDALMQFRDPSKLAVSNYDWVVGQLRHGIYYQGGPAIGRLDRPERQMMMGHEDMDMTMPGMPSGTTGGGGGMVPNPPGADAEGGHAGH